MNAKELAALAALGIGGAYLYNRNKDSDSGKPAGMPEYQGRTADRLADIQNEYGKAPAAPAAPAQDLEGRRTSTAIAPAAKKPAARPAAPAAQVAAPETPAGNPKLNSIRDTNMYKDSQRRKAALASEDAKFGLYLGDVAKSFSRSDTADFMKQKAAKKAADTAASQAIIDRMSKRTKPYMTDEAGNNMKRGGAVKKMASGGKVSSASSRGDGIAQRGKTRGKMC